MLADFLEQGSPIRTIVDTLLYRGAAVRTGLLRAERPKNK